MRGDPESHGLTPASFSVLTTEGGAANETTNTAPGQSVGITRFLRTIKIPQNKDLF